jgi:hypothetical protein
MGTQAFKRGKDASSDASTSDKEHAHEKYKFLGT